MATLANKQTSLKSRRSAPTSPSDWTDNQPFRVWFRAPAYDEDPLPWKCGAAFRYLQECCDYLDYCKQRGGDVVFQSPSETRVVKGGGA